MNRLARVRYTAKIKRLRDDVSDAQTTLKRLTARVEKLSLRFRDAAAEGGAPLIEPRPVDLKLNLDGMRRTLDGEIELHDFRLDEKKESTKAP